jgi:hypothetical protein
MIDALMDASLWLGIGALVVLLPALFTGRF